MAHGIFIIQVLKFVKNKVSYNFFSGLQKCFSAAQGVEAAIQEGCQLHEIYSTVEKRRTFCR